MIFSNLKYFFSSNYLLEKPEGFRYFKSFLITYLLITFGAILLKIFLFKSQNNKAYIGFKRMIFWGNFGLGLSGIFLIFARQQELPLFSLRIFNFMLLFIFLIFNVALLIYYKKTVLKKVKEELEKERIGKWLPKSKKA